MGFYLYFYLVLAGYLILFCVKIVDGLLLLLQLQMVLGNEVQSALNRCTVWQHTECDDTRYCKYTIVLLKMSTAMLETC
jgi:hypothetical protein